jgi:hypothetical protein
MDRYRNFDPCRTFEIPDEEEATNKTNKPTMNKENLLKMADYIETIPQEYFNMQFFRQELKKYHKCNSVGCIIGHCTILDEEENFPRYVNGDIDFNKWSKQFTGIDLYSDSYLYLFSSRWSVTDNTPTGAAKRIRHFVENGLPKDWREQMYGVEPLSYMNNEH